MYNDSAVPLLFLIKKSGSIGSGDLQFPSHPQQAAGGLCAPFSTVDIPFEVKPTLGGLFNERFWIINVW